jgi:signal transduction histidine kinase/CheY-like chemotaxis protein/HPt (histidine-containing phosphotransfer) domain-containing protein
MTHSQIDSSRSAAHVKTFQSYFATSKLSLFLVAFVVFATAYAGIEFTRQAGRVAILWPANAFMLAILLRSARETWLPYLVAGFVGNFVADWLAADPFGVALLLSGCNTIEIVVSILLFSRYVDMPPDLTRAPDFGKFLLTCGFAGPAASAAAAAAILSNLNGIDPLPVFQTWFAADSLGVLTIVPLLLMLRSEEWVQITRKPNLLETVVILLLVTAASIVTFTQSSSPLLFVIFPFLILTAFRLRFVGAALAMAILAAVSIPLTLMGYGPFALLPSASISERVLFLQIFLATVVFTVLPIAAVLTGRRKLEREALAARRAAERANAAKSAFLTNMSHELRTPMTGIIGMCDLLLASQQTSEQKNITETLERSARSFLELLNDLLDLAKIEAGRMDLDTRDFRLSQVMRDVQEFFTPAMNQKGLKLTVECDPTSYDVLSGDPKRLRQILFNLVGNALKFTDAGHVVVRRRQSLQVDGVVLSEFEVKDTGIGMSLEAQGRLFRPFEQEDTSTSRRFGGTGLGLNICKQIVEAMGGAIRVQSTQGVGSTFTFSVNLLPGLAEKIEHRFAITPARIGDVLKGHKLNILFAEDSATTQFLVREVMEMWGQSITIVDNGKQAVAKARAEKFDLILMDMQMPVMDGHEATRVIRKGEGPGAATPIIALTADAIPENRGRYLEAGCDAVVTKPIEWQALAQEIKTLVDHASGNVSAHHAPLPKTHPAAPANAVLPIFDPQRIDGLSEGLGPALMGNLLARCLSSMEEYLSGVGSCLDDGDFTGVRRAAHDLKSVCAQFGAVQASELARVIEAEAPDLDSVKSVFPELFDSVGGAVQAIRQIQAHIQSVAESQSSQGRGGKNAA